jgi:hypothetical protein
VWLAFTPSSRSLENSIVAVIAFATDTVITRRDSRDCTVSRIRDLDHADLSFTAATDRI